MIRTFEAPREREASMNSFSRMESTLPRMIRAMYGQLKSAMTKMTRRFPGSMYPPRQPSLDEPHAATMPMANRRSGSARMMSMTRETACR
jgi:hypothetical protein